MRISAFDWIKAHQGGDEQDRCVKPPGQLSIRTHSPHLTPVHAVTNSALTLSDCFECFDRRVGRGSAEWTVRLIRSLHRTKGLPLSPLSSASAVIKLQRVLGLDMGLTVPCEVEEV